MAAVVVFSSLIALLTTSFQLYLDYRIERSQIDKTLDQIEVSYLPSLVEDVWVANSNRIQTQLNGLYNLPGIEFLSIQVEDKVQWQTGGHFSEYLVIKHYPLTKKYRNKDLVIGTLQVVASLDEIYGQLVDKAATIFFSNALKTFIVAGFMLFLFNFLVTRHLNTLAQQSLDIDLEKGRKLLKLNRPEGEEYSSDELGVLETALNEMQQKIMTSHDELRTARDHANTSSRTKSEFLRMISHELHTPLNAILGFAQLIELESSETEKLHDHSHYAKLILTAGNRLLTIVDDIIDVASIEAGDLDLVERDVEIPKLFEDVKNLNVKAAELAGLDFEVEVDPEVCFIHADQLRLKQALHNLLSNAIKFSNPGGKVVLETDIDIKGAVSFIVRDQGIGMDMSQIDHLLRSFTQADGSIARKYDGTGLGLAIAKGITETHGGTLSFNSQPGKGTEVRLTLPPERTLQKPQAKASA